LEEYRIFTTKNTSLGATRFNYPPNGSANFARLIKRTAQREVFKSGERRHRCNLCLSAGQKDLSSTYGRSIYRMPNKKQMKITKEDLVSINRYLENSEKVEFKI